MAKPSAQTLATIWQLSPSANKTPALTAEANRYVLLVNEACPLSHSCFLIWQQKQLSKVVNAAFVAPQFNGDWAIKTNPHISQKFVSELNGQQHLKLPLLWDKQQNAVLSQDYNSILQLLNGHFNHLNANDIDFYPKDLQHAISEQQTWLEQNLRQPIYLAGTTCVQSDYVKAYKTVFESLQQLDEQLEKSRFLLGKKLTICDWQLFSLLIRFDAVYHSVFYLNQRYIEDYPQLPNYLRELFQLPGVSHSCHFSAMRQHFYHAKGADIIGLSPTINYFSDVYRPVW